MNLLVATLLYIFATVLYFRSDTYMGAEVMYKPLISFIVINYTLAAIFAFIHLFPKTSEKIKEKIIKFCSHK